MGLTVIEAKTTKELENKIKRFTDTLKDMKMKILSIQHSFNLKSNYYEAMITYTRN